RIGSGGGHMAVCQPRIHMGEGGRRQTHFRVKGAITPVDPAGPDDLVEGVAEKSRIAFIDGFQGGDSLRAIREFARWNLLRGGDGVDRLWVDSLIHDSLYGVPAQLSRGIGEGASGLLAVICVVLLAVDGGGAGRIDLGGADCRINAQQSREKAYH